jgi:hypothetical protein
MEAVVTQFEILSRYLPIGTKGRNAQNNPTAQELFHAHPEHI